MMDELNRLSADDLQELLDAKLDAEDRERGLVVVNRDDIRTEMWNATWDIVFDSGWNPVAPTYRAAADCESDALDEVIDWMEKHDPEALDAVRLTDEDYLNMDERQREGIEHAGNHGYPLHPEIEISITLVKRHRYSYGYY